MVRKRKGKMKIERERKIDTSPVITYILCPRSLELIHIVSLGYYI